MQSCCFACAHHLFLQILVEVVGSYWAFLIMLNFFLSYFCYCFLLATCIKYYQARRRSFFLLCLSLFQVLNSAVIQMKWTKFLFDRCRSVSIPWKKQIYAQKLNTGWCLGNIHLHQAPASVVFLLCFVQKQQCHHNVVHHREDGPCSSCCWQHVQMEYR